MKKIEKLQKFLNHFTPSVYWSPIYDEREPITSNLLFLEKQLVSEINPKDIDWNQTLITKINEVAARIYKDGGVGGPETILISGKYSDMQGLIHSLLYMKSEVTQHSGFYCIGKLCGRFDVLVIPELEGQNKIFVCKVYDLSKDPYNVQNYMKVGVVQILKLNE